MQNCAHEFGACVCGRIGEVGEDWGADGDGELFFPLWGSWGGGGCIGEILGYDILMRVRSQRDVEIGRL